MNLLSIRQIRNWELQEFVDAEIANELIQYGVVTGVIFGPGLSGSISNGVLSISIVSSGVVVFPGAVMLNSSGLFLWNADITGWCQLGAGGAIGAQYGTYNP